MSTKTLVLILLRVKPMTGYELAQNTKISVDPLWSATHSQIYGALRKLERDGLVESTTEVRGERMEKQVYHLTAAGEAAFQSWLTEPLTTLPNRDPFRLWAVHIDETPPEIVFRNIDSYIAEQSDLAARLEQDAVTFLRGDHPLIEARHGRIAAERLRQIQRTRAMIYRELATKARFEVESARRMRAYAQELYPDYIQLEQA